MKRKKAFTLVEILIGVVVIGILLLMALPNTTSIKSSAEEKSMKMRAMALTTAKMQFVRDAGYSPAATAWTVATTDQAKYELLKPYIQYPPANLTDYSIMGYSIAPGSTSTDAAILYRGTTPVDYLSANQ